MGKSKQMCVCRTRMRAYYIYREVEPSCSSCVQGGVCDFRAHRSPVDGCAGGPWRPHVPAGGGAPPGSPGARRSSPWVSGPAVPGRSSCRTPSTAYFPSTSPTASCRVTSTTCMADVLLHLYLLSNHIHPSLQTSSKLGLGAGFFTHRAVVTAPGHATGRLAAFPHVLPLPAPTGARVPPDSEPPAIAAAIDRWPGRAVSLVWANSSMVATVIQTIVGVPPAARSSPDSSS